MGKRSIILGTWEDKPIEWMVLKQEAFWTLVVSKRVLFSYAPGGDGVWKNTELRHYLNHEFWKEAFSAEERKKVVNACLTDSDGVKDNVFLLSIAEVEKLMSEEERRLGNYRCPGNCSDCFRRSGSYYGTCWYLRTSEGSRLVYVETSGGFRSSTNPLSIRPALYVRE